MNEQQMIIMVQETEKSFNHSVRSDLKFDSSVCVWPLTDLFNLGCDNYIAEQGYGSIQALQVSKIS